MFDYPDLARVASPAVSPTELKRELLRLVEEAESARARLAGLSEKIAAACEGLASIRSTLRGVESTPAAEVAQGEEHPLGERDP
jgi:hypothetical protein